jgi:hypothetical protein
VTSTNGHSEDYYQVPLKKNLKLENEEKITTQHSTHKRNEENTTERKKLGKQRMDSDGDEKGQGAGKLSS